MAEHHVLPSHAQVVKPQGFTALDRSSSLSSSFPYRADDNDDGCTNSAYSSDSESSQSARTSGSESESDSHDPKSTCLSINTTPALTPRFHLDDSLTRNVGRDVIGARAFSSEAELIHAHIEEGLETGSFLVTNLTRVVDQFTQWKAELPMVEPFYAVKCNPDVAILRLLASLGCNFDCATMGEIELVLNGLGDDLSFGPRGLAAKSIVYANPAKMESMLKYANVNGVRMTVFDGEDELHKIAQVGGHGMDMLLRLTTDDRASMCRFSKKFGCPVEEAPRLLQVAKSLGLNVAGVSFHVGSGCGDSNAYTTALEHALKVFKAAEEYGMPPMTIVDLGGGFPGDTGGYGGPGMPTFQDLARAIRAGIDFFGANLGTRSLSEIRFIAEPGRYFVSASTVVATKIYSRKGGCNDYQALYVDDGVYGTFNNVVYDHATPVPRKLSAALGDDNADDATHIPTAVFGPTCDGLDQMCSLETTTLPRCLVNEWLIWENMGAYTHTASFVFNGYSHFPNKLYCAL